jgi:hypothetical protein
MMKLKEVNLKFNPSKCEFVKTSIGFLGHVVSREGTQPYQKKVKAITKYPLPSFLSELTKKGPLYFCGHLTVKRHLKY